MLDYSLILKECKEYYLNNIKKEDNIKIPDEFVIMNFYDFVLNILNQIIFEYTYTFKLNDINFIKKYDINVFEVIDKFKKYI